MKRLLLLGLDAGDLAYIQPRVSALPFLQHRMKFGKTVRLDAPKALSGSVWPTFYNGVEPGWHGIYQHLVWNPTRMGIQRIDAHWCYYQPFWQEIEKAGYQVIVVDVPYSFPGALHRGVEITDWGTHGQTHPVGCKGKGVEAIIDRIGKSPIGRETPIQKTSRELENIRTQLIQSAEAKGALLLELMKNLDWDVFIAVFAETHRGGHIFFNGDDETPFCRTTPLLEIYQAVDRALARIVDGVNEQETAIMIFSAHGMARDYAQGSLVRPLMKRLNEVFLENYCGISPKRAVRLNSLIPYLRTAVPARWQYAVAASSPDWVREWVVEKEIIGGLDWTSTPAFALRTDIRTEIRLNLKGRESQGMLEPKSPLHSKYVDFLRQVFLELHDRDTDAALVEDVVDIHQEFPGAKCTLLPDYVITWYPHPPAQRVYSPLVGEISSFTSAGVRGGDHTDYGFA
ncbi:MAG: alkaline phosphatase family protein, partial [Nitrospirales bacterium]